MADPRTFLSFDFDNDEGQKIYFVGQARNSRTPFSIQDWSSKEALPQNQWEALVEDKISRCSLMIVLVGQYARTAPGIQKEIAMATRQGVPFFGVYVSGANDYSNLPAGLRRDRTIKWEWEPIAAAIQQMLGEGKNRHGGRF